jgi:hypothetical protein
MALDWNIDHGRRLVVATLQPGTTEEEMYRFLGEVIGEGAMPYGKIFDARTATRWISPSRIGPIAATARLYGRMALGPVGPLAIVVADDGAGMEAREFALLSDASRAVRIFDDIDRARAWLASSENETPRRP